MSDYKDLKVSIIGAGMGGLAAALALAKKGFKEIHIFEDAPALGFVGAGIQMAPNMIRILDQLGVWANSAIKKDATQVQELVIHDGATNKLLARVSMRDIGDKYGYPHFTGHRASLAEGLYEGAKSQPSVRFHFRNTFQYVLSFGPNQVKFVIKDQYGKMHTLETDILIGADGIKSTVRESILRHLNVSAEVQETGTAAYRILIKRKQLEPYPDLLEMLDSNAARRWIGEKRHIMAYPIHNHTIFNIATAQPDVNFAGATNATWTNLGDKTAMKRVFADFGPTVRQLLDLVPEGDVVEWRLRCHKPLSTWTCGAVALLGDACHPTLPHLSQGAAMAIEDAATLAETLSMIPNGVKDREAIAKTLKVYELLRKPRAGKRREERDRQFAAAETGPAAIPDKWASPEVQKMIYEHDCISDTQERFHSIYATAANKISSRL
ncbi:salicylate hydroxylase [Fusarium austroafricanum]|uniref:Salicylate hydroxylase n=1 Tax=Fusarium austroafricanum TaxID=2364996 RepID=A0A8H4KE71_9HYPO|nr:salicylate hydroxylase [Fusarium austroafricanum]